YGQGSSREHAAICPMYLGVRVVAVKSFERIHSGNLINFGIVPLIFTNSEDYDKIEEGMDFQIKNLLGSVKSGEPVSMVIGGTEYIFDVFASKRQRLILLEGGLLNYTKKLI
ncbi:MAG: aconitate hydratase, partial [Spirochaetota bacterium]